MRIRLLGPFDVVDADRPVPLGGHKQRVVLAALVLAQGRVVPTARLVQDVWGEGPPQSAAASLQAYVSNLRRALEPGRAPREAPRVLRSAPGGYLLATDRIEVDAPRFETLAATGRAHLRDGRPADARRACADALALWRGPALADLADEAFARADAARLEELRAGVLETRLDADLALGEHAAVVAELGRLVAEDPLREGLWARLIVALYRCGRQGDALAAYRSCHRALDAQLGIEPGPALRSLERDVLRQAPSLDLRPPAAVDGEPARADAAGVPASLVYRDAAGRPRTYAAHPDGGPVRVGRDAHAHIALSWDRRVSRLHAEIVPVGVGWAVDDDGRSSNGTYVEGERVSGRRLLRDGDELRFGDTRVTFRLHLPGAEETYLGTLPPYEPA